MATNRWKAAAVALGLGAAAWLVSPPGASAQAFRPEWWRLEQWIQRLGDGQEPADHLGGRPTTLVDEDGRRVTATGLAVAAGDQYISGDNRLYEIVQVADGVARVKFVEVVDLVAGGDASAAGASGAFQERVAAGARRSRLFDLGGLRAAASDERDRWAPLVTIYHSHNAESYVETSGKEFSDHGAGDIHEVGRTLKAALEEEGVNVLWSDNLHLPHDGGAYRRSRATIRQFLSKRPDAMLDVHRDATPAEMYKTEVAGEPMTKVRLVVGRQNHNRDANLQYAKEIKAIADERFPGLIEGIFHARGNYNQDVGPRTILLEFGTHETSLEEAEKSARLMAKVLPGTLGVSARQRVGASAWRTAGWLLLAAVVGVLGYMRINAGSWEEFGRQLTALLRLRRVGNR